MNIDSDDYRSYSDDPIMNMWVDYTREQYTGEFDELSSDFEGDELDNEDDYWI